MKPKIALFIRSLNKGGAEKQSILLAKKLSEQYNTKLIVLNKGGGLIEFAKNELSHEVLYFINGKSLLRKTADLYAFLKKNDIDILMCYLPSNNILGLIIGNLAKVNRIYGGLRGSKIKKNKLKMLSQKFLMNTFSTGVISNSYVARATYSNYGISKEKIQVIHNAIEVHNEKFVREEKPVVTILSVGRFVEEKDYVTALLAIIALKQYQKSNVKPVKYIIAGYGIMESSIRQFIHNHNLDDTVQLIINPIDMDLLYKDADIFLMTSTNEGMPNTVMEAMSWSLPIVATNAGDTSFLVTNSKNGFVCKIGDYKAIAEKLRILVDSSDLRNKFGEEGYIILKENFSVDIMLKKYINLIEGKSESKN
jgi:glycosyltransferase involved in cell wall biosynthesis